MDNYAIVEGEWADGKYNFRKIQEDDWDAVVEHVQKYFFHDEPTSELLGYSDDFGEEMGELMKAMLADNLSFLVEEIATGEIAAVRITYRHSKNSNFDGIVFNSRQSKILLRLCEITDNMAGLLERYDLEEYADFFAASCATHHRRQGITTEMYKRSLKFLTAEGFKLAKSLFTSPFTRAAVTKLGFEEVCRLDYRDLYDEQGEAAFDPDDLTPEHFAAIMVKQLPDEGSA